MPTSRAREVEKIPCIECQQLICRKGMSRHFQNVHAGIRKCWRCGSSFHCDTTYKAHVKVNKCGGRSVNQTPRRNPKDHTIVGNGYRHDVISQLQTRHVTSSSKIWNDYRGIMDFTNLEVYDYVNFLSMASDEFATPVAVFQSLRLKDIIGRGESYRPGKGGHYIYTDPSFPANRQATHEEFLNSGLHRTHLAPYGDYCKDKEAMARTFVSLNNVPANRATNSEMLRKCETLIRDIVCNNEAGLVITACSFPENESQLRYVGDRETWKIAVPEAIYKIVIYRTTHGLEVRSWEILQEDCPSDLSECESDPFQLMEKAGIPTLMNRNMFATINNVSNPNSVDDPMILPFNAAFDTYLAS